MKKIILILSAIMPLYASAQMTFDFEGGTLEGWIFNASGRWSADNVSPLNGAYSLHHSFDNTEASVDAAFFGISGLSPSHGDVSWNFTIRHGADPSASNKWLLLLMSDIDPVMVTAGLPVNGYAVGVNLNGYDDTLRLWHLKEGNAKTVISTTLNWQNNIGTSGIAIISVIRSVGGKWTLRVRLSSGSDLGEWSGNDPELHRPLYTGITYTYTSSRDRLLWLDDISIAGTFIPDTTPPEIESVVTPAPDVIDVRFSEEPDGAGIVPGEAYIKDGPGIKSIARLTPDCYRMILDARIPSNTEFDLMFTSLCDLAGNCTGPLVKMFTTSYAVTGDVAVTEIMFDPTPPVMLPDDEYIEITNIASDTLYMLEWILIADEDTARLPESTISPGHQIILCSVTDTARFSKYGTTMGITSFPSLNDSGEAISIRDRTRALIHAVVYSPEYYHDDLRSGGGWSIEMADFSNPFNEPQVWKASVDPSGGTPGRRNSVTTSVADVRCPEIVAVWPVASNRVEVMFDETLVGFADGAEWHIDMKDAIASSVDPCDRVFIVSTFGEFSPAEIHYIQLPSVTSDFAGNAPCSTMLDFGIPSVPVRGDVTFNEILFNPAPPCSDFVEFYNNSDKVIDLSQLFLSAGTGSCIPACTVHRQLLPEGYMAVTVEKEALAETYICSESKSILRVPSLPSMPDEGGTLMLFDKGLNLIDRVDYTHSMHTVFITGDEGISLEKINPALNSGYPGNWHSASESCNWGSPGEQNSIFINENEAEEYLSLSSERVSPDGDGFEDAVIVIVNPGGHENVITVTVFNDRGYAVRSLADRFYAGEKAQLSWDGTADGGNSLPAGLYIIIAESYNPDGHIMRQKKICALLYK